MTGRDGKRRHGVVRDCLNAAIILRQTAESSSFRYIVERRHLIAAADSIDVLVNEIKTLEHLIMRREQDIEDLEKQDLL